MTSPLQDELSDTALKLSQVIEREAKRSGQMTRVQSSFSSFKRHSWKPSESSRPSTGGGSKKTSSVAPVPEHAEAPGDLKDSELRQVHEEDIARGSKVAELHRQGSKMRTSAESEGAVEPVTARQRVWLLVDDPQSSQAAHYLSVLVFCFVGISTIVFIAQTEDGLAMYAQELAHIETICAVIFSLELLVRIIACPSRRGFLKNYANWIDISAILPFYLERILQVDNASTFGAIRIVRLTRVARVLKMSRYSSAIQVFVQAIAISMKALSMLIFLMAIAMIVFSSMIYFAEYTHDGCRSGGWVGDCSSSSAVTFASSIAGAAAARAASSTNCICVDPNPYKSIASSFWWCIVTMSTVGYGDMTPVTLMGKVVGCASVLTGMLVLALPITVIGTNFQKVMKSVMQQTMKSNVDYLKGKRMLCRNEIEAILERFHAVTEDIHLDVDDVINVYDEDNNGMLEDEELAKFRIDLEILQNRFMLNHHHGGGGGGGGSGPEVVFHGGHPAQKDASGSLASTWTLGSSFHHEQQQQQRHLYNYHQGSTLHPMRHSSTSSAITRPASGLFSASATSQEESMRRSTALATPTSVSVSGPGSALLQRDAKSAASTAPHAGSDGNIAVLKHPDAAHLPGLLSHCDPGDDRHHHQHHPGHGVPHELSPLSTNVALDSELFWLRMMEMQRAWEERLLETEQRLEAKLQNLTKILLRVEGMMELDD